MSHDVGKRVLFREVNQRIYDISVEERKGGSGPVALVCECGEHGCTELVEITTAEYEKLRSTRNHFLVLSGHESPDLAEVAARSNGYLIARVGR